ncbi:MAG: CBS domain-containing protein [Bdellovibrionota bacterium]
MRKKISVKQYMTAAAHSINSGLPVKKAKALMKTYGVRHLPVQLSGHLVGVITERDLNLAESLDPAEKLMVDDAMTPDPYTVSPDALIGDVVETMAMKKLGCAVVQDSNQKVVGIFTATDGLRALGDILNDTKRKAFVPEQERASR